MARSKKSMKSTLTSIGLLLVAVVGGALYANKVFSLTDKVGVLKDLKNKVGENAGKTTV